MSYTPGPWSYDDKNYFPPAILDSDDNRIATIAQDWIDDPKANAHLIKAAPDLLEFAERVATYSNEIQVVLAAQAVIAKARGQAVPA